MDKKTKILAGVFGTMVLFIMASKTFYPWYVEPLVTLGDRIARREIELDNLEEKQEKAEWAVREYRRLMDRIGSGDVGKVENAIRQRLNNLFVIHKLDQATTTPTKPHPDRKTGVTKMSLTINAEGSLTSVTSFLKDLSEFPQLVRVGNVSIFPKSSSRRGKKKVDREYVNLRVPIEVWVLPQHKMLGEKVSDDKLNQPEKVVRHSGRDYSSIWTRTPFTEFIPYDPLIAIVGKNQSVFVGKTLALSGSAKGGDGKYTYEWSGDSGLSRGDTNRPSINTSKAGTFNYSLEVSDDSGHVSTAQVTVDVKEKPPERVVEKPTPVKPQPPAPPAPVVNRRKRWPDGKQMKIQVALVRSRAQSRSSEIQIYNAKRRERSFYSTGDELDGGTLVFVHPRAALVRWEDEFYVYPIGEKLSDNLQIADASEFPRFQNLAKQILAGEATKEKAAVENPKESVGSAVGEAGGKAADVVGSPATGVKPTKLASPAKPKVDGAVQQGDEARGLPVVAPTKKGGAAVVPAAGGPSTKAGSPAKVVEPVKPRTPSVSPNNNVAKEKTKAEAVKPKPKPVRRRQIKKRRSNKYNKRRGRR